MNDNPYASPTTAPSVPVSAGTMRIRRVGVLQLAKLSAVFNLLFTAILIVPMMFLVTAAGGNSNSAIGGLALLILPIIYCVLGFIVGAVAAFIYNLVAGWVGGIELELGRA